jgi:DNA-binding NarL/FixJ family response regulator
MPPTVVIVDDHEPFRRSARVLLELDGYRVVGEAADGSTALCLVHRLAPDVVLLDVGLPDMSGFDVAGRLADGHSRIVLVSSRDASDLGGGVQRCGAVGFIPKDELSGERLDAVLDEVA